MSRDPNGVKEQDRQIPRKNIPERGPDKGKCSDMGIWLVCLRTAKRLPCLECGDRGTRERWLSLISKA